MRRTLKKLYEKKGASICCERDKVLINKYTEEGQIKRLKFDEFEDEDTVEIDA